ncbi:MAG: hypothetical protein QM613_01030 [Micrococcaceae bacterium]
MNEKYHKPVKFDPSIFDSIDSGVDSTELVDAAERAAHALINHGRNTDDDEIVKNLVQLADTHGLSILSEVWEKSPSRTLPGSLWRIYAIRATINEDAEGVSNYFKSGRTVAEVSDAIAGAAEPADSKEIVKMADQILTGAFKGDFAVALERFAAFCRVVAVGQTASADNSELLKGQNAKALQKASVRLLNTAEDLEVSATLWRNGTLR